MTEFKLTKKSVAACATLLIFSAPAFAGNLDPVVVEPVSIAPMADVPRPSGDWYVSVFAGASHVSDVVTEFSSSTYTLEFGSGFVAGLTFGKRVSDQIRVEGELSFSNFPAETVSYTYGGGSYFSGYQESSGDLDATYLLANVWYDIPTSGLLNYYVGGGIGVAKVDADTHFFPYQANKFGYGPGETKLAGQIGVGAIYDISETLALDIAYRYKYVRGIDFVDIHLPTPYGIYENGDVGTHSIQVGLAYSF
ncbi:putative outer membrane protein [Octadecabacter arcticus 238]|uniref:Putative outer membrane protein n=1 Tax=Octadecabacter arcticus 238 TaxID=391616 RepID=M9RPT5_9RHOB|nr:outer membrane beta-barrel protein [Octadecabacter arcticus]AGI73763.1 putative outer membrane protein [Octadecabacter arcticus 238]